MMTKLSYIRLRPNLTPNFWVSIFDMYLTFVRCLFSTSSCFFFFKWLHNTTPLSYFHCVLSPGSCSQLFGLPGVSPGWHGAQLSPHIAAGDQSTHWPIPLFIGRRRERHLQDEQLLYCDCKTAGEETGGEHCLPLQVRKTCEMFSFVILMLLPILTCFILSPSWNNGQCYIFQFFKNSK